MTENKNHACEVWGVLNVTPDSFSDGGEFIAVDAAAAQASRLVAEGADVIDIGGESSRPAGNTYGEGFAKVSVQEECARVLPIVERLANEGVRVSIDTIKGEVADAAIQAGASIVNDVSCATNDALLKVVAKHGVQYVLMHNRRSGEVAGENIKYDDVASDVIAELEEALQRAESCGVNRSKITIDPGLGFAKTARQSADLLANLHRFVATGQRVLLGASRKSLIAELAPNVDGSKPSPMERLGGGAACACLAVMAGCHAVRVHDVVEMCQVIRFTEAVAELKTVG